MKKQKIISSFETSPLPLKEIRSASFFDIVRKKEKKKINR